jgi:PqqD family protein of HPr-rel-A system
VDLLRWRTPCQLAWRRWDDADEWVVFNPASGHLHLLNEPAARLLRAIEASPATLIELADRIDGRDDRDTLNALVASLDALGLVEPERS